MTDQVNNIIINVISKVNKSTKQLQEVNKTISRVAKNGDRITESFKKVNGQWKLTSQNMVKNSKIAGRQFQGWAMSIMFFGMAVQRVFSSIWKASQRTFQDVSHSVDGAVTGFDMLEGSMKFLQFTAGAALEPLAEMLVPFVDKMTDIIGRNPEMVAGVTKWGSALGGIFMVGGTGALAINGFLELGDKISGSNTKVLGLIDNIGKVMGTLILIDAIVKIVTTQEDFKSQFDNLLIGAGLATGATTPGGLAVLTVGIALKFIDEDKFYNRMAFVFGTILKMFGTLAEEMMNMIFPKLKALVSVYEKVTGRDVGFIDNGKFDFTSGVDKRLQDIQQERDRLYGRDGSSQDVTQGTIEAINQWNIQNMVIEANNNEEIMEAMQNNVQSNVI